MKITTTQDYGVRKLACAFSCIFFTLILASSTLAQDVVVLMANGDRVTGSLLEYRDGILKVRSQSGVLKIPAKDLILIEFKSNRARISGEAYLHMSNGKKLLELGLENEAVEEFRAAIRRSPMYADAYYELGVLLEKQGKTSEAMEYIDRAIAMGPDRPDMARRLLNLADDYFNKGELEAAAERYYLLFARFPESEAAEYAVYRAGFLFAQDLKDNESALAALEGAVAAFPTSQFADRGFYELGRIYEEEESLAAAESALVQLVSNFPSSQWVDNGRYILARVYHRQRRNKDAIREIMNLINESSDAALVSTAKGLLDGCMWVVYGVSDGLPAADVRTLALDGDYLWIGTSAGIARFDLMADSFTDEVLLKGTEIRALAADDRHLWIGTQDAGIKQYDKVEEEWIEDEKLPDDRAFAISIDSNSVWIGTALNGVYRYAKFGGSWSKYTMNEGLSSDNILSIVSTAKGIWSGTLKRGACFFDQEVNRWQVDPEMAVGKSVTSISAGANYVWFAWYKELSNGASRYDASSKSWEEIVVAEWEEYTPTANIINLGANDEEMWIGTDTGVLFYNHATSSWSRSFNYPSQLAGHVPPVCVLVGNGSVWFATSGGLGRLDRNLVGEIEEIGQRGQ